MDQNTLQLEIEKLLSQHEDDESLMINKLEKLVGKVGTEKLSEWRNATNKSKNTLIHELVEKNCPNVIQFLVQKCKLDPNIHREIDGKTPLELAEAKENEEIVRILEELRQNKAAQQILDDDEPDPETRSRTNIVWVDLEMTSIENPKIMECAVIITDKYLNELDRSKYTY